MNIHRSWRLIFVAALLIFLLTGCQEDPAPTEEATVPTQATLPVITEPTEPEPTTPPDGNPEDVTCQGSYTADTAQLEQSASTVVATMGDASLTNAMLQLYYQMAINTYRSADHELMPDFTQPLDTQLCLLDGTAITWQQYFLQQALTDWQSHCALSLQSKNAVLPLDEAYDRDEQKHADNLKTKIYNLDLLYGYNSDYEIADAHQAYLDSLPELLTELAAQQGLDSASSLSGLLTGGSCTEADLLAYATMLNEGYMYLTELSYYIEPTDEQIQGYYNLYQSDYAELGIHAGDEYVNLRHILLIPEDAEISEDGTVTCSQESWDACLKEAEALLAQWSKKKTEENFSDLAFRNSQDTGSSENGGLYSGLKKGQLTEQLDAWCFDPSRQAGDTTIIRTDCGYHILYFCQPTKAWYAQAKQDLITYLLQLEITLARDSFPLTVDYSSIRLHSAEDLSLTPDDLLYPDIAHERFPVAPLYFQQDYPDTMYGEYSIVTHGCGITTMSMLVSYMTDNEWTPPELSALYGRYCSKAGTAHAMFTEVPLEWDFHVVERVFTWDEALAAMEDGYMVITLQRDGYWTNGGHYLLLHNLIETEDGTKVQVWDSNLYNYKRLEGHTIGYFDLSTIPSNSRSYWIYQKKVTRYDSCVRCAAPTEDSHVPFAMFTEEYVCEKCDAALLRRNAYMSGCSAPVSVPTLAQNAALDRSLYALFSGASNYLPAE